MKEHNMSLDWFANMQRAKQRQENENKQEGE